MAESEKQLTEKISPYKIIYPVVIGLAVVSYMLYKEFDVTAFQHITFTWHSVWWLVVAVMCMFVRDFGYVVRIKVQYALFFCGNLLLQLLLRLLVAPVWQYCL